MIPKDIKNVLTFNKKLPNSLHYNENKNMNLEKYAHILFYCYHILRRTMSVHFCIL